METALRQQLIEYFEKKKNMNPRYSLRNFAKDLGVSPGRLSLILANKSGIGRKTTTRIAQSHIQTDPLAARVLSAAQEILREHDRRSHLPSEYQMVLKLDEARLQLLKKAMRDLARKAERLQAPEETSDKAALEMRLSINGNLDIL